MAAELVVALAGYKGLGLLKDETLEGYYTGSIAVTMVYETSSSFWKR